MGAKLWHEKISGTGIAFSWRTFFDTAIDIYQSKLETRRVLMRFREFMLEEGDMLDAIKHGVSTGVKAYKKKRSQQKKRTKQQTLTDKIMAAEGDDLKNLISQIVDNGYTVRNGKVQEPDRVKHMSKEVLEHVFSQRRHEAKKDPQGRSTSLDEAQARKLVGHT
jgi:hypothetical protein